jgi:hypothetical protein
MVDIPPEGRELTLTNLDQPVNLALSTSVSWLDNVDRQIARAQLLVNGLVVQDVDPGQLAQFEAAINNFQFGANRIQVAIVDDQGSRATSPEIVLNITQGAEEVIPEAVAPSSGFPGNIGGGIGSVAIFGGGCFLVLFVLFLIIVLTIAGRHSSLVQGLGLTNMLYFIPPLRPYVADAVGVQRRVDQGRELGREAGRYSGKIRGTGKSKSRGGQPAAYLEIIEAVTPMPNKVDLDMVELRVGRSANQADLVFKNDNTVSRIHTIITLEGSDFRIHDEQSTSGTFVNEQRVPAYGLQLTDGDEIRLGAVRMRFRQP